MSEAALAIADDDPVLETDFAKEMVRQMRAVDTYGTSDDWQKSLVGAGVFTHEAGIHVDGLMKGRLNYQGVDPTELGRDHRIVLGKHSGSHSIIRAYADMGVPLTRPQAESLLLLVRRHAIQHKRPPVDQDLCRFYLEINGESPDDHGYARL